MTHSMILRWFVMKGYMLVTYDDEVTYKLSMSINYDMPIWLWYDVDVLVGCELWDEMLIYVLKMILGSVDIWLKNMICS